MRQSITRINRIQNGFTIIEVLVVVVIIGVIAAVAIPNVARILSNNIENVANTEATNVKSAAVAYFGNYRVWPDDSTDLADYLEGSARAVYHFNESDWVVSASPGSWGDTIIWDDSRQRWVEK
jgi:prepilin-type N-terminal cleavage/methylation domain-containing protein